MKKAISIILALVVFAVTLPSVSFAATSGTCGDNLTWTLDDEGTLTISGTGAMTNYQYYNHWIWCGDDNLSSIKSVVIESGVTSIGSYVFYGCSSLTSVTIGSGVTSIGACAFERCSSLTGVTIGNSVTSIGSYAFYECTNLTSVEIPNSVTSIGNYAFEGCNSLTSVEIPNSVTSIGKMAFYECYNLTSVTIGNSVTSIGKYTFSRCTSLTSVTIGNGVTNIGTEAFRYCNSLTSVTIPNSVTSIGEYAFENCTSLTSITIPNSVMSIGNYAFENCTSLTSVTIGNSVTSIGYDAFCSCIRLTSVTIGNGVTSIGIDAFEYCYSLTDVYYTGSESEWKEISIDSGNSYLKNATIHYNSSVPKTGAVKGTTTNIADEDTNSLKVSVYENEKDASKVTDKYVVSKGATVIAGGKEYITDEDGTVSLVRGFDSVTVVKYGYNDRTMTEEALEENDGKVYLQKTSDLPVINSVIIGNTDVLTSSYKVDLTSKEALTITADITGSYDELYLTQSARRESFSNGSITMVISDKFDVSQTVYIVCGKDGKYTKKALKFEEGGSIPDALDGLSLTFGNSIKGTIPGDNAFFGGGKVELDLPMDTVPITATLDGNKVYVSIGIDVAKYKYDSDDKDKKDSEKDNSKKVKFLTENIKKDWKDAKEGLADLKNINKKYNDALEKTKGSFGFSADFSVIGFGEGYIDSNGKIIITEAGIIPTFSLGCDWSGQFHLGPVPIYWEAYIKAELEAQLNLYLNSQMKQFTPNGTIEFEIKLGGGGGVGINKLATVGGGIEGSVKPHYEMYNDQENYFKLTAKYGAYFKAVLGFAEYKKTWKSRDYLWFEHPDSTSTMSLMELDDFDMYNIDNYSIIERSYAENASRFVANDYVSLFTSEFASKVEQTLKTNIYPYSEPQIEELADGAVIAVWLDDNTSRSDVNRTSIYYSVQKDGVWSEPEEVDDDGTADFSPYMAVIDGKARLVWSNAKKVMSETDDVKDIFGAWEISYAEFDGEKFSNIQTLTDNDATDMTPVVFGEGESIFAAWTENSSNDVFSSDRDFKVVFCELGGENEIYADDLYAVDSIAASVIDGKVVIAYSMDSDGDESDVSDKEIYLNNEKITDNDYLDSKVFFDGGELYWYADGSIAEYDVSAGTTEKILPEGDNITNDRFEIISNANGNKAIVFGNPDGLEQEIYAYIYDKESGNWGNKIALTEMNSNISSFSGVFSDDGSMKFLINKTEVTGEIDSENPYGETSLALFTLKPSYDLSIDDVYFDSSTLVGGNTLEFDMTITNSGCLTANGYSVEVLDEDDNVLAVTYDDEPLLPGEKRDFTAYYPLGDEFEPHSVTLRLVISDEEDSDDSDNVFSADLNYEDFAIENLSFGMKSDNTAVIYGNVVNRGYGEEEKITVTLYKDSVNGEAVDSVTIDNVPSTLEIAPFAFDVEYEQGAVYYAAIDSEDMFEADNYDFVVLSGWDDYEYIADGIEITENGVVVYLTADAETEAKLIVAAFGENDRLISTYVTDVSPSSVATDGIEAALDLTGAKYVEAYVWDSMESMKPIAKPLRKTIE